MFCFSVFSQQNFSEKALMGRGDLVLEGTSYKLQKETLQAFKEMKKAALKEGIDIKIVSGYRSFNRQKNIWNRKYNLYISQGLAPDKALQKIIEYSTIPGTSRHHWGTDFDIIDGSVKAPKSLLIESNYEKNGVYAKLKKWMDTHAESFGFYLVYTNISSRKGFKYEPWHYTYKPLSDQMLLEFRKINLIEFYKNIELNGSQYLTKEFLSKYTSENILDINIDLINN
ncbi:M15 family metallopeptidase [Lutibacter sp. A64]|uniref:M15 family metallopeptidase n=1 Tax=Lutibacter sp. A64 TaxID=2918526 RepID=UPI001F0629B3|nr:M15 family metallopeptidase [Lutibacter sp. A64]UMB54951.1 M15 family metallopeptidase [Lutibacter sp. A64]